MPPHVLSKPTLGRLAPLPGGERWHDPQTGFSYPDWQVRRDLAFYAARHEPIPAPAAQAVGRGPHGLVEIHLRREETRVVEADCLGDAAAKIACRRGQIAAFGWRQLPAARLG